MGFLSPAAMIVARAAAAAMLPPPPPDITRWCEENIVFDERSPMPGPFSIARFPFLREIHEVLSPEHPCKEVTVQGSAQIAKTESIINPTVAAWHDFMPLNSLVVHPTQAAARDWVDQKWFPLRRSAPGLLRMFGRGGVDRNSDTKFRQETLTRTGILKVCSAGSPDDLAQTSHRLVVMDDLSKFEMQPKGDPEKMAVSRASAFDDAKILRASTPLVVPTCRISNAYQRSDRRRYYLPCPHCGHRAPLTWENFRAALDPERLHAAHFTCESCGNVIAHSEKERMLSAGAWVAENPRGDHPGFHLWRAYAPQRDWASIAVEYAQIMGWSSLGAVSTGEDGGSKPALEAPRAAETEQTFWNDVLGLPFEMASGGPDWQALRDRVEDIEAEGVLPRGVLPALGVVFAAGVDCQQDRTEVQLVAFGPQFRRWIVDHIVIPHNIGDDEGIAALDSLLKSRWRTAAGRRLPIDMMAIDLGGHWYDEVWSFARRYPWGRVILVKGATSVTGPVLAPMKFDRRADGRARRAQKRAYMLNVSQMKGDFYGWLGRGDPLERGHVAIARGLGDEFFRQLTSEVRVPRRQRSGVVTSSWELVDPARRNECLDCTLYAEAAARRLGWAHKTEEDWARLHEERGTPPEEPQGDLFDATLPGVKTAPAPEQPETKAETKPALKQSAADAFARLARR